MTGNLRSFSPEIVLRNSRRHLAFVVFHFLLVELSDFARLLR